MLDGIAIPDDPVSPEDAQSLPVAAIDSEGNILDLDLNSPVTRFLQRGSNDAGGLTLNDAPSALTAPLSSASSAEGHL